MAGPSTTITKTVGADQVLHLFYGRSASTPWRGISPIQASTTTRKLLDNLELRLAQETGESVGHVIPVPNVKTSGQLQTDIRALKGQVALVESTSAGWGVGATGAPQVDFKATRIGANPPATLVELRRQAEESILAACGINPSALANSDGTLLRESFRQFLHLTIQPIALEVAGQVADRFDIPGFDFSFDRLMAGDVQGRARAFAAMAKAGMDLGRAAALSGLIADEE